MSSERDSTFPKARLDSVCRIIQGGRQKLSGKHFVEKGYPAYGAGGHNGDLPTYEFDQPAIVLSSIGARCGKCFQPTGKWSSLANTAVFFPDPKKADIRFLWYQLNDEETWHRSGTAQPYIKPSDIKGRVVALPPLPEQKRIAAILDAADALRAKRRQSLALLDQLLQSTFLHMFGDPVTNPKGWPTRALGDVCDFLVGFAFPSSQFLPPETGIALCRGINVAIDSLSWTDRADWTSHPEPRLARFILEAGDIVLAMDRPWISGGLKMAEVQSEDTPALLVQRVARMRCGEDGLRGIIKFLLRHHAFARHCNPTETTIPHISPRELKSFPIITPPRRLRSQFATVTNTVNRQKVRIRTQLIELDTLFASLQQRAFRGDL